MGTAVTFRRASEAGRPGIWQVFREAIATGDTYMLAQETPEHAARCLTL